MKQDSMQVERVFEKMSKDKQLILLEQINYLLKKVEEHKKRFEAEIKDLQNKIKN